jgi:hypothetical protein
MSRKRTYFSKECGKASEAKSKSGSGQKLPFKSSWPWYKELSWLRDHISYRDSTSNLSALPVVTIDDIDAEEERTVVDVGAHQGQSEEPRTAKKRCRQQSEDRLVKAAEEMVSKFPVFNHQHAQAPSLTEDELFGKLVAKKMSKIPEGEEKDDLKMNIQLLIKQAMYRPTHTVPSKEPMSYPMNMSFSNFIN